MKLSSEKQLLFNLANRMRGFVNEILSLNPLSYDETVYKGVRDYLKPLLIEHEFDYVAEAISTGPFEVIEPIRDYKTEILFVLERHIESFDLLRKHKLMLKRICEMTGYEYKEYLGIIGRRNADIQDDLK